MRRLKKIISRFSKAKILVVGDVILDEYIWGNVERISPEAPVPILWANKRTYVPGGAANAANNIRSLGARVSLAGVSGRDKNKDILFLELKKRKIITEGMFTQTNRHTTLKTRIIAGHQQIVRVDWEHTDSLNKKLNQKLLKFIDKNIKNFDAVIIEDYGKGVINSHLLDELINLTQARKKIITVDPKEDHFQYYRGVTAITPNRHELENAIRNLKIRDTQNKFKITKDRLSNDRDINLAAGKILDYLKLQSLLVTMGDEGMRLFSKGQKPAHIPTVAQEVFDVSGAGDTVISAFTLALSCGGSFLEAARIANLAAGIVVGKVGTAVTTRKELIERLRWT